MEFAKSFNLFGVEGKEIPCITGSGAPSVATKGAVGCLYMDTNTGYIYKCRAAENGVYTWEKSNDSYTTPEMFGAVGDGVTDDTEAMRQAFQYPFVLLDGGHKYFISEPITAGAAFRRLNGSGATIILKEKAAEGAEQEYFLTVFNTDNVVIEHLSIEATKNLPAIHNPAGDPQDGEKESSWCGIGFRHCSNISVRDVTAKNLNYTIHISHGDYKDLLEQCNRNILLENIHSYNCKMHIFACYCTNLNIYGTKHQLNEPTSKGWHTYYMESFVGDVVISGDFIDISNTIALYSPYDFASYNGAENNANRNIVVSNFICKGNRLYNLHSSPKFIKFADGFFWYSCATTNPIGHLESFSGRLEFDNCTFYNEDSPVGYLESGIIEALDIPIVYKGCTFKGFRPVLYTIWDYYVPYSANVFTNCYFEVDDSTGLTPIPCHGYAKFSGCHFYGSVGYTPSFVTKQNESLVEVDGKLYFDNCKFESTSTAYLTGPEINKGETCFNNCQLITTAGTNNNRYFRTQPTKDCNTVVNYALVT